MFRNHFHKIALSAVIIIIIGGIAFYRVHAEKLVTPAAAPPVSAPASGAQTALSQDHNRRDSASPMVIKAEPFVADSITIKAQNGDVHPFDVELALTPAQQAKGMMFRTAMPDDFGMLFVFKNVAKRSFWMKNTLIPLDLLFIGRDGKILHIHPNAIPQDLTPMPSIYPAYAVLEIKGGKAAELGINKGDKIKHRFFR